MAYGNLNVDTITGSGASSVIVNNGSANVCGFTTGNNLQMLQNGGGIVFSNSSALTNSTFNDYEIGTWTPTGSGSTTLTVSSAYYTKIGRFVYAECDITFSSQSDSTACQIGNLPFTANSVAFGGASLSYYNGANTNPFNSSYLVFSGQSYIAVKLVDDTGGNRTNAQMSGQRLILSITYTATF